MNLIPPIEDELKQARLARDEDRRDALSLILASLRSAQKELQRPLSDDEELQVLQRERKRRAEAADAYEAAGREEQAEAEEYELEVLEEFMPEPLSEDELEEIIDDVIAEVGATSRKVSTCRSGMTSRCVSAFGAMSRTATKPSATWTWSASRTSRQKRQSELIAPMSCQAATASTPSAATPVARARTSSPTGASTSHGV